MQQSLLVDLHTEAQAGRELKDKYMMLVLNGGSVPKRIDTGLQTVTRANAKFYLPHNNY